MTGTRDVNATSRCRDSTAPPATIALCIPTYRRNELLRQCLDAVAGVNVPPACRLLVLVADNDAAGGARSICEEVACAGGLRVSYVVEPRRGLCFVRNRLLGEALRTDAAWIAFLDDDEQPAPGWLAAHLHALSTFGADVSCGPVVRQMPAAAIPEQPATRPRAVPVPRFVACNNVLFRRKLIADQELRFDPQFNLSGGEDFDFFEASRRRGNRHVWTGTAIVLETITPERATLGYLFRRHCSGAMTRVAQQRKWYGHHLLWPRFLVKIGGKLVGGTACLALAALPPHRESLRECIKRYASACGYLCGLLHFRAERYR